jgi:glycerol-3-phosphate dehydrogenase
MTLPRDLVLREIATTKEWDVLVIGGGATGLGTALEAASRGYRTLLIEKYDFAKGTSSRSTKLVHGGVRYLGQLNLTLVRDALRERGYMIRNAPHLVHRLSFVVPAYNYASIPYYGFGLKAYELTTSSTSPASSSVRTAAPPGSSMRPISPTATCTTVTATIRPAAITAWPCKKSSCCPSRGATG